ncbi:MAG: GntR family transcriptional regulator [Thermoanaerobaculia bacterium]
MQLHIATGSELPIYRQIMRQITDAIAGGRLRPGDKLTSQRDLAVQLVISPLTVKKAYDELEREGLIRTERGRGTFVASGAPAIDRGEQLERLREMARRLLSRAHLIGVPLPELLELLEEAEAELAAERSASRDDRESDQE